MKFPGIKIIDRYIIRKFLGTYFFAIALIIVVVVIFDAAEKIDDFIELKAPLSKIVLQYYLNFIPFFINQFSGLFTFIAVIFFTSKLAYQTEIIAILSAGISFRRRRIHHHQLPGHRLRRSGIRCEHVQGSWRGPAQHVRRPQPGL